MKLKVVSVWIGLILVSTLTVALAWSYTRTVLFNPSDANIIQQNEGLKILWDEGHGQYYDSGRCSSLISDLEGQGVIVDAVSTELNATLLSGYSILVIPNPQGGPLTQDEISDIADFVQGGGGLILLSDVQYLYLGTKYYYGQPDSLNDVLRELGVVDRVRFWGTNDCGDDIYDNVSNVGRNWQVVVNGTCFNPHMISEGIGEVAIDSASLNVTDLDVIVATTPPTSYTLDVNGVLQRSGRIPWLAALEVGEGKVVICGSSKMFSDTIIAGIGQSFIRYGDNEKLFFNFVWWLTPFRIFTVIWQGEPYYVITFSNSTVTAFNFSQPDMQISFNVTTSDGTSGFCNTTIPKKLLNANSTHPWVVLLDGNPINYTKAQNDTHTFIYFTFAQGTHRAQIIGTWVIPKLEPRTIWVPDNYTRIEWAVRNAISGDTIRVRAGIYYEHVVVYKAVSLIGEDKHTTIIDGNGTGTVIKITVNNVNVSGFTVQNSGTDVLNSGVCVERSSGNNISHNIMIHNYVGIHLDYSDNNILTGNTASSSTEWYGIALDNSGNNVLADNIALNNHGGILLSGSSNNNLTGNVASNNCYGISLLSSSNNTLANNTANSNYFSGISLSASDSCKLRNNNISNLEVWGVNLSHYIHDVDVSNKVTGKPVYYWINQQDRQIPLDTGCAVVVNSTNITVQNLNTTGGVTFAFTTNSVLINSNLGRIGLCLSSVCQVSGNKVNNGSGFYLYSSDHNNISRNIITNNYYYGILLDNSGNNTFAGNIASNNRYNFGVRGSVFSDFDNHIDTSNTVDGKPIFYLIGVTDAVYDAQTNAGTVCLINCKNITIRDLNLTRNYDGVFFWNTTNSKIVNVTASNNWVSGVRLQNSNNNTITGNTFSSNNWYGIGLYSSSNNVFFHNNFINNTQQVSSSGGIINTWDNGLEGNYWSNYVGVDLDHNGIGDAPHAGMFYKDNHPLMGMFSDFPVDWEKETFHVTTICNSSISNFALVIRIETMTKAILFYVTGPTGTVGFCRICIPTALMNGPFTVFVNGTETLYTLLPCSNATHSYLYFTYNHSTKEVLIIPEFPSALILPLLMIVSLVAVVLRKNI